MILEHRLHRFQEIVRGKGIDAVMIRTLSSFIYFTGLKWLRPALLIPSSGEPIAFVARGEEEGFRKRTWIRNVVTYTDGGDLMGKVSGIIRKHGFKTMGLEFGIERDAYIVFYEMFKRLNPSVKIVDVSDIIYGMRLIKDQYELDAIRKAGRIASKAMEEALSVIEPGVSETEIAAEIYRVLYKNGSEEPLVYVNVGPDPRIHSEPFRDNIVENDVFVTIVIGADYNRYYANMARTVYVGNPRGIAIKAIECMDKVYETALKLTRPGTKIIDVIKKIDTIYRKYGLENYRVIGYLHGVGLQIEEPPITTILPRDRFMNIQKNMVLAMVHSPLLIRGVGQVKKEDTFIVGSDSLERVTVI